MTVFCVLRLCRWPLTLTWCAGAQASQRASQARAREQTDERARARSSSSGCRGALRSSRSAGPPPMPGWHTVGSRRSHLEKWVRPLRALKI